MIEVEALHRLIRPDFNLKSLSEIINAMLKREKSVKAIELGIIQKDEAKKLILDYIEKHPGCWTDDIFMNLRLDPIFTVEVLNELKREGLIEARRE